MRSLILTFSLCASVAFGQYDQVVKPVRINDLVSFTQFQLRQSLIQLFKNSSAPVMISANALSFVNLNLCKDASVLSIARSAVTNGANGLQIREALNLSYCGNKLEVFSLERQGENITPLLDDDLIRGVIANSDELKMYRLSLMNKEINFEIMNSGDAQKMNFSIVFDKSDSVLQLSFLENSVGQALARQTLTGTVESRGVTVDEFSGDYIWTVDTRTQVPRQYLYVQSKEVAPSVYLKLKDSIFNKSIYPTLSSLLNISLIPMTKN
ncbi:MAG: hypothetical protein H7256_14925 [Bdellovibrio sp.]|nr:hypothetical protein [Bdellovibrio sp.]